MEEEEEKPKEPLGHSQYLNPWPLTPELSALSARPCCPAQVWRFLESFTSFTWLRLKKRFWIAFRRQAWTNDVTIIDDAGKEIQPPLIPPFSERRNGNRGWHHNLLDHVSTLEWGVIRASTIFLFSKTSYSTGAESVATSSPNQLTSYLPPHPSSQHFTLNSLEWLHYRTIRDS